MPYFALGDPEPRKTAAELEAEETPREKLDDADARHPLVGWALFIGGVFVLAGIVARACLAP